ncbi:MAG: D-2-hydroxyacid dehydrogenase [Clostridia bacterium]|nr:D-2-hydroxyacid dehydrogenase [Clostridia bacterium]
MTILVTMPHDEVIKKRFTDASPQAEFIFCDEGKALDQQLSKCDIIIGTVPVKRLVGLEKLKWIHLSKAGANEYVELSKKGVLVTVSSGAYGLAISEHMLGMLLMLMKKLHLYRDNQNSGLWNDEGAVDSIFGATVLVVGVGDIGGEFAKRCHKLGAYVIGIRRMIGMKPDYLDELHDMSALHELIKRADVLALSLPGGEDTHHIISRSELEIMKRGTIILNVGRGNAIDTEALADFVADGRICCGLDVTDPEPLPKEHRLWYMKNAFISPHISGFYHLKHTHDRIVDIACENIRRYFDKKELLNLLDEQTGYRMSDNRA